MNTKSSTRWTPRRGALRAGLAVAATLALGGAMAPVAQADLLSSFSVSSSSTQAGAPSDMATAFAATDFINNPVKELRFHLPAGVLGTIGNFPTCPLPDFYFNPKTVTDPDCPEEAQVGIATIVINAFTPENPWMVSVPSPVYVLKAGRGNTAMLGVKVSGIAARNLISISVRPDDYGLDAKLEAFPNNVSSADMVLWGVPWDHWKSATQAKTKRLPFMINPARCGVEDVTKVDVEGYANQGVWEKYSDSTPAQTGCEKLEFEPSIWAKPDAPFASSPSGFSFGIDVPQTNDPIRLATPPIKNVTAVLPEGVSINPSVANGLEACTDEQLGEGSMDISSCPAASRVGTAEFQVPALLDPEVKGTVYIGQSLPGNTYRLFIEGYGSSMRVKLKGTVKPDPKTGQLTATFENNPQAQVASIKLSFKGGQRAALAMPDTCGSKQVTANIDSWSGQAKHSLNLSAAFDISFDLAGHPCPPQGFAPSFTAGTVNPAAGASSPFALRAEKPDGQAALNGVALTLPEGLLANLKGNLGTRIGTARVAAGVGTSPYWLSGSVVLEGAYGDAPFSLRVTVPVIAGPFNLGNVVVRQKIYVDSHDAHVTIVSDPLPTIWEGIPVRLQGLQVDIDKAGFMKNPTSCAVKTISGVLGAATGQKEAVSSRFQAGDCASLPLAPKMRMDLIGKKETKRGKHPQLSATLTQKAGESGLRKVKIRLPLSLALDPDNAQALCKPEQAAAKACPAGSIVGKATAVTPLLDKPLTGNVYFVEGTRVTAEGRIAKTLPKLWVALRGQVALDVWADSALGEGQALETTFGFVPDAPISSFKLDIDGGAHGILAVTGPMGASLCKQGNTAKADYDGQTGKHVTSNVPMGTPCGFQVSKKSLTNTHAKITVAGIAAGKVAISGKGIRKASRTIRSSSVATIQPRLTSAGMRTVKRGKSLRLRVSFNPKGKGKTRHKTTVVKPAKKAATRSHRSR